MTRFALLIFLLPHSGYSSYAELKTLSMLHLKSALAWRAACHQFEDSGYNRHFTRGWKQGYFNVCNGGEYSTPVVPPRRYWLQRYKPEKGRLSVAEWFEGYNPGSNAANFTGEKQLNTDPSQAMIFEKNLKNRGFCLSKNPTTEFAVEVMPFESHSRENLKTANDENALTPNYYKAPIPRPHEDVKEIVN